MAGRGVAPARRDPVVGGDLVAALVGLGHWLYSNVLGNEVASILTWLAVGLPVWIKKIHPHLEAQREHRQAERAHREHVVAQLAELHTKHDALHQAVNALRDQPER